jgi:hypothetical protein
MKHSSSPLVKEKFGFYPQAWSHKLQLVIGHALQDIVLRIIIEYIVASRDFAPLRN